jgi:hypothetical protein
MDKRQKTMDNGQKTRDVKILRPQGIKTEDKGQWTMDKRLGTLRI